MQVATDMLLQQLTDPLRGLASRGCVRRYRARTLLIQEGDAGSTLFIVLAGRVKVFTRGDTEREFVFGAFGAGALIGELALDGGRRSASVMTLEPTICAEVTLRTLQEQLHTEPQLAALLLNRVISCARFASNSARGLALQDVYQRVIALLEQFAETRQGERGIFRRLSQREVAARVGASREMVGRILNDLQRGGYLRVHARGLLLLRRLPAAW